MEMSNALRVVIDTNIWISFLIGKAIAGLNQAIINDRVIIQGTRKKNVNVM
jgi:putative PIN family toxin of toxin-antitoxin system